GRRLPCLPVVALQRGDRPCDRFRSHGWHLHERRPSVDWPRAGTALPGGKQQPLQAVFLPAGIAPAGCCPYRRPPVGRWRLPPLAGATGLPCGLALAAAGRPCRGPDCG
ncbi:hypothetical protein BHM03_00027253, partial [Ensete ventricosum]